MAGIRKSDAEIQQDVLRELTWDTRVEAPGIGVAVDNGIVTLTGTVSSWGRRQAAEQAAHRVAHVLDVANDIEVKLPTALYRTDAEVARAVRHALEWDVFVPDARIQSTVSDGRVPLEGSVDTPGEREDAARPLWKPWSGGRNAKPAGSRSTCWTDG